MNKKNIREIYWEGTGPTNNYFWIFEIDNEIVCQAQTVFDWDGDEIDNLGVILEPNQFLEGLLKARQGERVYLETNTATMQGLCSLMLDQNNISIYTNTIKDTPRKVNFDCLFLDTLSVFENFEPQRRTGNEIQLGAPENLLLNLAITNPNLVYNFYPKEFESVVTSLLIKNGFEKVNHERLFNDGNYDIFVFNMKDKDMYTVIVDVRHITKSKVELEIVDRLNGIRDRKSIDWGLIFTRSGFSIDSKRAYNTKKSRISLIDFEKMTEFLKSCEKQWSITKSELWTLPLDKEFKADFNYYSAFISYGEPDRIIAEKINNELKKNGVKTFLFSQDAIVGEKLHRTMREGVNKYERIILICSKSSLDRKGVMNEIEETLQREAREGGTSILIPITFDDYIFNGWSPERIDIAQSIRDRVIGDFRNASKNSDSVQAIIKKLLIALNKK